MSYDFEVRLSQNCVMEKASTFEQKRAKEAKILSERIEQQKIVVDELKTLKKIGNEKPRVYSKQPNLLFKSDRETELLKAQKTLASLQAQYGKLAH